MRATMMFVLLMMSQSAFAIYMTDGVLLSDGKVLQISSETLTKTIKSGIKDARGYQDYVMQGQSGGKMETWIKNGVYTLKTTCSDSRHTIKIYVAAMNQHKNIFAIETDGNVYLRSGNDRGDNTTYHIESIENFDNIFESLTDVSGQSETLELTCRQ